VVLGVVVGVCVCVFLLGWLSGTWGVDHRRHHHHLLRSFILSFDIVSVC
jgi:Tfp pilus assembly protein PilN